MKLPKFSTRTFLNANSGLTNRQFQKITLWIGVILILGILGLTIFLFYYKNLLLSNPCELCMDRGFNCFRFKV